MGRLQAFNQPVTVFSSGETHQKVISHRPFHMFITVDMNMCIDRSTCS